MQLLEVLSDCDLRAFIIAELTWIGVFKTIQHIDAESKFLERDCSTLLDRLYFEQENGCCRVDTISKAQNNMTFAKRVSIQSEMTDDCRSRGHTMIQRILLSYSTPKFSFSAELELRAVQEYVDSMVETAEQYVNERSFNVLNQE